MKKTPITQLPELPEPRPEELVTVVADTETGKTYKAPLEKKETEKVHSLRLLSNKSTVSVENHEYFLEKGYKLYLFRRVNKAVGRRSGHNEEGEPINTGIKSRSWFPCGYEAQEIVEDGSIIFNGNFHDGLQFNEKGYQPENLLMSPRLITSEHDKRRRHVIPFGSNRRKMGLEGERHTSKFNFAVAFSKEQDRTKPFDYDKIVSNFAYFDVRVTKNEQNVFSYKFV